MTDLQLGLVILTALTCYSSHLTASPHPHRATHSLWGPPLLPKQIEPGICIGKPTPSTLCTSDCVQIVTCINNNPYLLEDCSATGLQCYQSGPLAVCTKLSQCGGPILCAQSGQFPDPDFCTKYHNCPASGYWSTVSDCPDGTAYSIVTNECDLPTTAPVCGPEGPVPTCTTSNYRAALEDNPSYYYKCLRYDGLLYPGLYWCGENSEFNSTAGICNDPVTTTPLPITTTDPTTTPDSTTTCQCVCS